TRGHRTRPGAVVGRWGVVDRGGRRSRPGRWLCRSRLVADPPRRTPAPGQRLSGRRPVPAAPVAVVARTGGARPGDRPLWAVAGWSAGVAAVAGPLLADRGGLGAGVGRGGRAGGDRGAADDDPRIPARRAADLR